MKNTIIAIIFAVFFFILIAGSLSVYAGKPCWVTDTCEPTTSMPPIATPIN